MGYEVRLDSRSSLCILSYNSLSMTLVLYDLMIDPHPKALWEVLVPRCANDGTEYTVEYHHIWDTKVRHIAGGITILRTAKGQWINPDGVSFIEEMIPVRIHCSEAELEEIIDLTLEYYDQEAVFAYKVSEEVKIKHRRTV